MSGLDLLGPSRANLLHDLGPGAFKPVDLEVAVPTPPHKLSSHAAVLEASHIVPPLGLPRVAASRCVDARPRLVIRVGRYAEPPRAASLLGFI